MIFHVITIVEYCNMTFHWHCLLFLVMDCVTGVSYCWLCTY